MTTRRSEDLDVPSSAREPEAPLPANVRQFPFIVGPHIVLEIALRERERATEKAVARHGPKVSRARTSRVRRSV
jgi:hypothetical protein